MDSVICRKEKKEFKLLSGEWFYQDLAKWMNEINFLNKQFDFRTAVLELLENTESKLVKYGIKHGLDTLNSNIAVNLYKELGKHLAEDVRKDIMEIEQSLKGNSFFNLTDEIIPKELADKLNLGKKYCPFFRINKNKRWVCLTKRFRNSLKIILSLNLA